MQLPQQTVALQSLRLQQLIARKTWPNTLSHQKQARKFCLPTPQPPLHQIALPYRDSER